jgi:hypothetical protein
MWAHMSWLVPVHSKSEDIQTLYISLALSLARSLSLALSLTLSLSGGNREGPGDLQNSRQHALAFEDSGFSERGRQVRSTAHGAGARCRILCFFVLCCSKLVEVADQLEMTRIDSLTFNVGGKPGEHGIGTLGQSL